MGRQLSPLGRRCLRIKIQIRGKEAEAKGHGVIPMKLGTNVQGT